MKKDGLIKKLIPMAVAMGFLGSVAVVANDRLYIEGQEQLDNKEWKAAQRSFARIVEEEGKKSDAALYWLAYAQFKSKEYHQALASIKTLAKRYPDSRWVDDAQALKIEIRDKQGSHAEIDDEEMKLYAINALMNSSSDKAIKILESILDGEHSAQVKKRAMFVLSQSGSAGAFEKIADLASGKGDPSLQVYAIETLSISGSKSASSILSNIYKKTGDTQLKLKLLKSFMVMSDADLLFNAAKNEQDKALQTKAIRLIGAMGRADMLWSLYSDREYEENKEDIIQSLAVGGGVEQLNKVIQSEKQEELVLHAVEKMGIMGADKTQKYLEAIYKNSDSIKVKERVIKALFIQSNAKSLINIAKSESEPQLKREAIKRLSMINSDEVLEYFSETFQ
ncbi:outer membrane protein assembly factor BamD [Pleionea sp. CnH1-48]|uniref:outer membrane protein assembly factor BamD n=1 Tax=Pleionea sp. CnH1-48 TaxID=2954494 RepID=UPI0020978A6E|nr:outer membrane protein assembly factor BamD [Pleionea sp. CnH1-48]MCO7225575.1 outer membrane protein assembly factor BamD [Pleionea sp. CnH1-48]